MKKKCKNCKWWFRGPKDDGTVDKNGTCYRCAPKPARITREQAIQEDNNGWPITRWPETAEYMGCGDFTNRDEPDLKQSISALNLSARLNNALWSENIRTVQQLIDLGRQNAKRIRMIGSASIREVSRKLAKIGIIW